MMKVAQCWDDGVLNDIRVAELLRKYQAKATFNLNPGLMTEERQASRWFGPEYRGWSHKGYHGGKIGIKELPEVLSGFQVASHCWRHENAGSMPDEEWIKCAVDARKFLEDIFQRDCLGFAWPCGRYTPGTVRLMHAAGFVYGRTTEYTSDVLKCADPITVATNCHFQDGQFWEKYEAAKSTGVFYFWGHSYEMFEYEPLWKQYEDKIRIISEDPETEWVDVVDLFRK